MDDGLALALAGEPMRLLADRALYWPARRRLLVADLHLGKADTFRAAGIALPSGGTALDLGRLATLARSTGATSAWILGDVLHGRSDLRAWRRAWHGFRVATPALELTLTDASDQPLARRVFLPQELSAPQALGPRAEWNGSFPVQVQELPQPVVGYRAQLFYP